MNNETNVEDINSGFSGIFCVCVCVYLGWMDKATIQTHSLTQNIIQIYINFEQYIYQFNPPVAPDQLKTTFVIYNIFSQ